MKDRKKFIKKFCRALEVYWIQTPELRFGQLPSRISFDMNTGDIFYWNDEAISEYMDKMINKRRD